MSEIKNKEFEKPNWWKRIFIKKDGEKRVFNYKVGHIIAWPMFTVGLFSLNFCAESELKTEQKFKSPIPSEISVINIPDIEDSSKSVEVTRAVTDSQRAKALRGSELVLRNQNEKIVPGTFVKARLVTGASNGLVKAQITENIRTPQGEVLIQNGAILIGSGTSGSERLLVRFEQLISVDGQIMQIEAQACERDDQSVGLRGSMIGNKAVKVGLGIGLSFVGGMSVGLQDRMQTGGGGGFPIAQDAPKPSLKNALLNGAATAALDESRELMTEARNQAPIIHVPAGKEIFVLFSSN